MFLASLSGTKGSTFSVIGFYVELFSVPLQGQTKIPLSRVLDLTTKFLFVIFLLHILFLLLTSCKKKRVLMGSLGD